MMSRLLAMLQQTFNVEPCRCKPPRRTDSGDHLKPIRVMSSPQFLQFTQALDHYTVRWLNAEQAGAPAVHDQTASAGGLDAPFRSAISMACP